MPIIGTPINLNPATYKWDKARLETKQDLLEYIKRKLGYPVINIAVTDEQVEDAIYDTLELYMERAYAGVLERYIPLTLLKGVTDYVLPYDVFAVLQIHGSIMGGISSGNPSNIFSLNQFVAADLYRGVGKIDLLTYELTNHMLASLELVFGKKITFDFNCISKTISLFESPPEDEQVLIHCYRKNIPEYDIADNEITNIYNERFIKKYSTELTRKQWGHNLMKYGGSTLPAGLTISAQEILQEANTNLEKLDLELQEQYELPCDFFVG